MANQRQRQHLTALRGTSLVVIIRTNNKNCGTWSLDVVSKIYPEKDAIVHAVELKTRNGMLEHATQHLYPLELTCNNTSDTPTNTPPVQLNPRASVFRPRRDAAVAARARVKVKDDQQI